MCVAAGAVSKATRTQRNPSTQQAPIGPATGPNGAPADGRVSCGLQLRCMSTLQPAGADALSPLDPFTAGRPRAPTPRVVRELSVEGWALYWTAPSSSSDQQQHHNQQRARSGSGSATPGGSRDGSRRASPYPAPFGGGGDNGVIAPGDFIVPPVNTFMRIAVRAADGAGAADGAAVAVDVLIGATDVHLQVGAGQLVGMARLADAAAVWERRNRHGRFRPSGWRAVGQVPGGWAACGAVGAAGAAAAEVAAAAEDGGKWRARLVPAARAGLCAPVTWQQVWRYAGRAVMEQRRAERERRAGGAATLTKRDGPARRRYMVLYRRRLEHLQQQQQQQQQQSAAAEAEAEPSGEAAAAAPAASRSGGSLAAKGGGGEDGADEEEEAVAGGEAATTAAAATAPAAGERVQPLGREEERELQLLELRLGVADILLARSLAEAAVDRQEGSGEYLALSCLQQQLHQLVAAVLFPYLALILSI